MGLTNTERQRRWRERVKARALELNGAKEPPVREAGILLKARVSGLLAENFALRAQLAEMVKRITVTSRVTGDAKRDVTRDAITSEGARP